SAGSSRWVAAACAAAARPRRLELPRPDRAAAPPDPRRQSWREMPPPRRPGKADWTDALARNGCAAVQFRDGKPGPSKAEGGGLMFSLRARLARDGRIDERRQRRIPADLG